MEVQAALGSEIVMVFDECAPGNASSADARRSMELTARWAKRSREKFDDLQHQGLDTGRKESEEALKRGTGPLWYCPGSSAPRSQAREPGTHSGNRFRWLRYWRSQRGRRKVCHVGSD